MKINWQAKTLEEMCEVITRGISPKYIDKSGILVLNQRCIRNHVVDTQEARRHDCLAKSFKESKLITIGDVLVNSTGVGTLGRIASVKELAEPTTVDSHVTILRPKKELLDKDFFAWMLVNAEEEIAKSGSGASGQIELSRSTLKEIRVSYPKSLLEQKRIVKILDEVFANIEKAKINAEKNLMNAKELFELYLENSFRSPKEDWRECRLIDICEQITDGSHFSPPSSAKDEYPYITVRDIAEDKINFKNCKFIDKKNYLALVKNGCKPNKGDLLFSKDGTVGKISLIDFEKDFVVLSSLAIIKPIKKIVDPRLLKYVLANPMFLKQAIGLKTGTAIKRIVLKNLKLVNVSLPNSLSEQKSLVSKLDLLSAETKKLQEIYKQKLALLDELKESVLKKAFSGEL